MGMDPVASDETYEVTIQLQGPVNIDDFQKFRDELDTFLKSFPPAANGTGGIENHKTTLPNGPKTYLQVRASRQGYRQDFPK